MANIDVEMGQFQKVTTLENKDYIVVSLDNGTQGQIKVSDLASVVAAWMPFQKITRFPVAGNAMWFKLGVINNYCSASFIYSNTTFGNVTPAIYAVCASVYEGYLYIDVKLIAGKSGGVYENNIKYKFENNALHFWVRGSAYSSSTLIVLTGDFIIDGTIENPPSDAIQPSF